MDVLVIGGTGLISTGIVRQLVAAGHGVTAYHRGETTTPLPDSVEHVYGDRTDYDVFETRMADIEVDCVIDMVCFRPADARSAIRAFEGRIEQFVLCSTESVHRRPFRSMPVTEDAPRRPPTTEYGADKARCEDLLGEAYEDGAFEATILRPWQTYGEGGSLLHTFGDGTYYIDRIRRGKPIVVHGDGSGVWGPCHRDDVARAFVNAVGNEQAFGEAYLVTSDDNMSWRRYHRRIADALDAPDPELVTIPTEVLRAVAPDRTDHLEDFLQYSAVFDNSKARRDLDFEYTIDWETGVRRTVDWLEERDRIRDSDEVEFDDRLIARWRDARDDFVASFEKGG
ncbi:NAD-dependent epimerase/dehydratase family protein [Halostagnicola sp. A-GB9-2]|uniref:NAD-dependent epimerase/dehydratase family protein n=1 Tax=Halostagnicola sp. A-GB9-2 TaxID=3048066 RepID=UPI0024C04C12|nr:NAD-dependent epimerase/dehydratase family protein [Halostagnicola sp. A-GB9-2]MDJ1433254.1 NAD-dependent epimerase/dehydratase family protein [Halostagnicola sp. A-GB9-2]